MLEDWQVSSGGWEGGGTTKALPLENGECTERCKAGRKDICEKAVDTI